MPKTGWRPLPGVSRNNVDFLRRQNSGKPFLWSAILMLLLSALCVAGLIYFVSGG